MACLADFAEHRRFHLLWQHHINTTVDGIEHLIAQAAHHRCRLPDGSTPAPERTAILGSDGRYHLHVNGRRTCHPHYPNGFQTEQMWEHTQSCHWWSDGHRYLLQAPRSGHDESSRCDRVTVHYTVQITDTVAEPDEIPRHLRCPVPSNWPALRTSTTELGRLREQLIEAFGPLCSICRDNPGQVVDHDHFTRYVRGLVCQYCNAWVDRCMHPSGCGFADYLNQPPATSLRLVYPRITPLRGANLARARHTGMNPFPTTPTVQYLHSSDELRNALGNRTPPVQANRERLLAAREVAE